MKVIFKIRGYNGTSTVGELFVCAFVSSMKKKVKQGHIIKVHSLKIKLLFMKCNVIKRRQLTRS